MILLAWESDGGEEGRRTGKHREFFLKRLKPTKVCNEKKKNSLMNTLLLMLKRSKLTMARSIALRFKRTCSPFILSYNLKSRSV